MSKMKSYSVETLCEHMSNVKLQENRVQHILNCIKRFPKIPVHVQKAIMEDQKILERRIKREQRKFVKMKPKTHTQVETPKEKIQNNNEIQEEETEEYYEESYVENDEDHFDVDNFNDL